MPRNCNWQSTTGSDNVPFRKATTSWTCISPSGCLAFDWKIATAGSFIPPAVRLGSPDPDPDDGFEEKPDPDPEDENEADQNDASITTRSVPDGNARGGDGTINPPFP